MKPALLALDLQNDFFGADNPNLAAFENTIPVINAAIAFCRSHGWPVIFIQHVSPDKPAGSPAAAIDARFACLPDDPRLWKTHPNAFWNTQLDMLLKSYPVDFVVVAGYLAEQCVLSTLRGASERGYRAAILAGSIASLKDRYTQFALELSPHLSLGELETLPPWR